MERDTAELLEKTFSPAQMRLFAERADEICQKGFGSLTVTFWKGHVNTLEPTMSIKMSNIEEEQNE